MNSYQEKLTGHMLRYLARREIPLGVWWRDSLNWLITNEMNYAHEIKNR